MIADYFKETWVLYLEMAPYLVFGFALAGLLHAFVSRKAIARHLGGESFSAVLKAALIGVPLPLCSCGVVPTAIGLRKRGASRAATVSFLISTPQTGVDSILVTYGFFGWVMAIYRPIAEFVSGIVGGMLTMFVKPDPKEELWVKQENEREDALAVKNESLPFGQKLVSAYRFAFFELLGDIALWLVLGILAAGLISAIVPDDYFAGTLGGGIGTMLLMMLIGLPMYVCSTASVPIAAVLMTKGISAGAAFVFLMSGPATNIASMAVIWRALGGKILAVFLLSIGGFALLFGLGLDYLTTVTPLSVEPLCHVDGMQPGILGWIATGLLTVHLGHYFFKKIKRRFAAAPLAMKNEMNLQIEGMSCSHCVKNVKDSLERVAGVTSADVSLEKGLAVVKAENVDPALLAAAVEGAGYKVKE